VKQPAAFDADELAIVASENHLGVGLSRRGQQRACDARGCRTRFARRSCELFACGIAALCAWRDSRSRTMRSTVKPPQRSRGRFPIQQGATTLGRARAS
jgi:hypothetical protein